MENKSSSQFQIVIPGEYIGSNLVSGHGTYSIDKQIFASFAGVVHQVGQIIYVKPLKKCYEPQIGDVVVGRIVQVDTKRWTVDIGSYQHAILNLNSTFLAGGEQRRKSAEDSLQMKSFLKENEIICAEVQQISSFDGKISLQTKSAKYSKLINGLLFHVDHNYIKKVKTHMLEFFQDKPKQINCIIGTNGNIWIYEEDVKQKSEEVGYTRSIKREVRENMAILRNSILALEKSQIPIFRETILKVLDSQSKFNIEAKNILQQYKKVTEEAKKMIEKEINMERGTDVKALFNQYGHSNNQDIIMD